MNKVTLHDAFVGKDCEGRVAPIPAVTAEAGAMWMDLYNAVTTEAGRYVQGGGCTTVGVAGLVQSGGFGSFSKGFGTAASGLLEAEIVTAAVRRFGRGPPKETVRNVAFECHRVNIRARWSSITGAVKRKDRAC